MTNALTPLLHGLGDAGQLVRIRRGLKLHRDVAEPIEAMKAAALEAGVQIRVCSGHRSFKEQRWIWNAKATGRLRLLDSNGERLDARTLEPDALIDAILRWSALPGASRHHWGTDMDVYDVAAVPEGYDPKLTVAESEERFGALHAWLDSHMQAFGFFRPYATDRGGVAPEPWHLSYAPRASEYFEALTLESLRETLASAELALKDRVLARLPELFERYTQRITPPPARETRAPACARPHGAR